jgi:gluconolactonase
MRRCLLLLAAVVAAMFGGSAGADDVVALVSPKAEVVKVVGDCKFTEGPAFSPKGFLLFSDIPNSRIVRVDADGTVSDFLKPSGAANGLVFDKAGNLYACQGGARRVVKIGTQDGKIEPLCDSYDGKPLNSPNDLALDGHGGLYFTDPRYGGDAKIEQSCMGVYYVDANGKTTRVIEDRARPNGILVSNDHKMLLVAEPNKRELWSYAITAPGKLGEGKLIFTGDETVDGGGPDGMCLDEQGHIYTTYKSIVVLKSDGSVVGRIPVPEHPANCTFGGADGKTLYITARTSLYSLGMNVAGASLVANGPKAAPQVSLHRRSARDESEFAVGTPSTRPTSHHRSNFRGPARLAQDKKDDAAEAKETKIQDITLKVPASWKEQPPANKLRLAQFLIPKADGDEHPTELVISSFPGGGGGVEANLKRWTDQFSSEGRKVKITSGACPQGKYVLHDVKGTYLYTAGGPFAGGKKEERADHRSISVVLTVEGKGNYFLRLTGTEKAVSAALGAFRASFGADASKEKDFEI